MLQTWNWKGVTLGALCVIANLLPGSHAFVVGFQPSLRPGFANTLPMGHRSCARSPNLAGLEMAIEGSVNAEIQRNFGDKFFLKGEYMIEGLTKPRTWTFRRSWKDFQKLDKWIRREWDLMDLPEEPYLLGAESDVGPFKQYLAQIMSIDELLEKPQMYEFLGAPNDVLVTMLPGKVPIDVTVKEGETRYKGESEGFSVPVLDPVMLAESAGKNVAQVNQKLAEAELTKKAGQRAGEVADEWKEVLGEATEKVDTRATGKAFGSIIGNLRSGKGLFGEEKTTEFASKVMETVGLTEEEEAAAKADEKWDLVVKAPSGSGMEDLEVTVRPAQKWRVLLKPFAAEAGGKALAVQVGGSTMDSEAEIGASGLSSGATVEVVFV